MDIIHKLKTYADAVLDQQIEALCAWIRKPTFPNLPTYADNTAAKADGLEVGQTYRTSTGQVMVVY